jgi:hypothetical protein
MAEEIIFKVGVDTGDSKTKVDNVGDAFDNVNKKVELTGRSFKELQDELKKVTQELQSLNPTSKEFENLTKKANDLKKEMKAVGDSMNETTNDTNKSFTNLRKELKQLTIQLQSLDPASKEFETVAKRAGSIKEQLRGVADAINDADPEKFGGKFQRTAEGIAGSFSAITGAQALFGSSTEEIEKQMLKVQGAIALTQGISAMKELRNDFTDLASSIKGKVVGAFASLTTAEMANATATGTMTGLQKAYAFAVGTSTGAMKAFRLALVATGIGALVIGLGFLIEKMMSYTSSTADADKKQKALNTTLEKQNTILERNKKKLQDSQSFNEDYAKAVGASDKKVLEIQKKGISDRDLQRKQEIFIIEDQIKQLRNLYIAAYVDEDFERAKELNKQIQDKQTAKSNLIKEDVDLKRQLKLLDANFDREQDQKRIDKHKAELAEIHANNLKKIELENARILEQETLENEYYDSLKTQQDLEVQAVRDKYNKIIETTKDNEVLLLAQQKELDAIATKYKEEKDKTESERKANIAQQEEDFMNSYYDATTNVIQKEKDAINEKYFYLTTKAEEYGLSTIELERQRVEELNKLDEVQAESKRELANAIGGIFGELAGLSKQASNIQKAFAITQVAIDTATALSGLTAISFSPTNGDNVINPLGPYIKLATGTTKIISNMARVKGILGSGVSVTPPTIGGANANLGANTTNGTQPQQQVSAQSTYKVVVVDSDITKMQDKTKKVQAISTI